MNLSLGQIIEKLRASNQAQVARDTGLSYDYIRHLVSGRIANPGSRQMDVLRSHFGHSKAHQ